jgi:hypothetical protein
VLPRQGTRAYVLAFDSEEKEATGAALVSNDEIQGTHLM